MVIRQRGISQLENTIIEAIQESGLSQKELAAKSGVSQGLISLFLERDFTKRRTITMPVADRLCRALGLRLVMHKKIKKVRKKMARMFPFREGCDLNKVRKLCKIAIKVRRGKMISERVLDELDSQGLKEGTKNTLSKWVNPRRDELVQPLFEYISIELFGYPIERSG